MTSHFYLAVVLICLTFTEIVEVRQKGRRDKKLLRRVDYKVRSIKKTLGRTVNE